MTDASNFASPGGWHPDLSRAVRVDTSEHEPVYLLTTERGAYLRLSSNAYRLLRLVEDGYTPQEIASRAPNGRLTPAQVEEAYATVCDRLRGVDEAFKPGMRGLRMRVRILSAPVVERISGVLAALFDWRVAAVVAAATVLSITWWMRHGLPPEVVHTHFWSGYALLVLSLVAHELGHAAACARFGARPAEIGAGLYFIFPAFYSNVTDAWRLKRWERVTVDLGGVYFQIAAGAAYLIGYLVTGWVALAAGFFFVVGSCMFSLNPLLRFDGYWVLADALGVTNLGRQAGRLVRAAGGMLVGGPRPGMPWPGWISAAVLAYSVVCVGLWAMFIGHFFPVLAGRLAAYPAFATAFAHDLVGRPSTLDGARVKSFLTSTYSCAVGGLVAWRMLRGLATALWRRVHPERRPAAAPTGAR
jgi:putative peptide zinc metalloprotease protein